ncbi:hypothetical protein G5I_02511 [Acromyrmex echinatior]|uniref:Uncharacterized protein n=1 Tax=Acromyrmex echinatior TaxID=103372 RepID=F4WAH5_ACREC|nr:hypothetical protein G5I_02511 [Acromyrmex echinatior]
MADLHRVLHRGYIKARITRLRTRVTQANGIGGEQAEARLEKLEDTYNDFESIQQQLLEKEDEFNDALEQECFEERYFEVKFLLKRCMKLSSASDAVPRETDAVIRLLQQQTELMEQIHRDAQHEGADAMTSRKLRRLLENECDRSSNESHTRRHRKRAIRQNALEIRPVTVNLDKHSRMPTIQVNFRESTPPIAFMLDTDSGPNIIKENFVPKDSIGSYQTSSEELNNSGIAEESFHTSLLNSILVDCKEVNNQISLCNATQFCQREPKEKTPL